MSVRKTPLLITGPVKSGKTSELIRELRRYETRNKRVIAIKHAIDVRDHDREGLIRSRDGTDYPSTLVVEKLDFEAIVGFATEPLVIGIDEGQFFGDQLAPFVMTCVFFGHQVIVSALNANFFLQPFPCVAQVASFATTRQLFAICQNCGNDALHSRKIGGDPFLVIEVDSDSVQYVPHCTNCVFSIYPTQQSAMPTTSKGNE
jgi:thymidine kinase